jgi:hypothetical protein
VRTPATIATRRPRAGWPFAWCMQRIYRMRRPCVAFGAIPDQPSLACQSDPEHTDPF